MPEQGVWDPGATSCMGSIYPVAIIDEKIEELSRGRIKGKWYKPTFPRQFRVANGQTVPATYEVEYKIPLARLREKVQFVVFRVAAVDTGRTPEVQVPWLVSNEFGGKIGALAGSKSGLIRCEEEPLFKGWNIQMQRSSSGHWLFPLAQAAPSPTRSWRSQWRRSTRTGLC